MKHIQQKIILQILEAEENGMIKLAEAAKYAVQEGYLGTEINEYSYSD